MVTDSCCSYSTFCDPYSFCHIWQPSSLLMAVWTYTWRQGLPHVVVVAWMSSHLKLQMSLQPSQLWSWQQRWHTKQHGLLFQNKTFVVQASGKHLKHYTVLWPVRVCVRACVPVKQRSVFRCACPKVLLHKSWRWLRAKSSTVGIVGID